MKRAWITNILGYMIIILGVIASTNGMTELSPLLFGISMGLFIANLIRGFEDYDAPCVGEEQ